MKNNEKINKKQHSLRAVVFTIVGICLAMFMSIFLFFFRRSFSDMLLQSENRQIAERVAVITGSLETMSQTTDAMCLDTAAWDETITFVRGTNFDYFESNWPAENPLPSYGLDFMVMRNPSGRDVYIEFWDYETGESGAVPEGFSEALTPFAKHIMDEYTGFLAGEKDKDQLAESGILFIDGEPYYVSGCAIAVPTRATTPAGVLFMGNRLDSEYLQSISNYPTVDFRFYSPQPDTKFEDAYLVERANNAQLAITMPMKDIYGDIILLEASGGRSSYTEGMKMLGEMTAVLLVISATLLAALYAVLSRKVLRPLTQLTKEVADVSLGKEEVALEQYCQSREFTALASALNSMLERLRESNMSLSVFTSILNGMDAFLYVTDTDTDEILFINDKMRQEFGLDKDVVGQPCWRVLQNGMDGRCDFCPVTQLNQKPGEVVMWEEENTVTGRTYRNADVLIEWRDKRMAHLQHGVDITETKRAQELLQKRLEQQELMSSMSQSFISSTDQATLIENALRMSGEFMDLDKVLLSRVDIQAGERTFVHEWYKHPGVQRAQGGASVYDKNECTYEPLMLRREPDFGMEEVPDTPQYAYLRKAGVLSFMAVPIYSFGELWGVLYFDDCTGRREWSDSHIHLMRLIGSVISGLVERGEREENLVRMSSIVDASPQPISYMDMNGRFSYVNRSFAAFSGRSREALIGEEYTSLYSEELSAMMRDEIIPQVLRESEANYETYLPGPTGDICTLQGMAFLAGEHEKGIATISTDITDRRRMEKELVAAKEQAEQSSLAKSNFLSRMSHEMRTPMNAIIGMTSIAKTSSELQRKEYCLDKIEEASNHLLGVINDILDVSKIEAGKFELSFTEFNFERMIIRVTNVMNFRIEEKKQLFSVRLYRDLPRTIISDEQRLAQVLTNLLGNAVKFTPEGGNITLRVQKTSQQGNMCMLRVSVEDTGIGIPDGQQDSLFRSFEQADGGIARRFGGTGLGLSISKSIVELMGGRIWVESKEGEGSEFIFEIPAEVGSEGDFSLAVPGFNWDTLRMLVVDDAPEVLEYFTELSQAAGFSCDVASGAKQAIEMMQNAEEPYNIVFVDWSMPEIDGIELTRHIKTHHAGDMIVVMISSTEWSNIEKEATAAGVNRFLPKPLFSSQIVDCINEYVDNSAPAPEQSSDISGIFAGYRVLLAEDVEINREIAAALLEETQLEIENAQNGAEAVKMFSADPNRYDLILMDIHMPEMDGYEATRILRAMDDARAKEIPIVAMTANVFREDIEKCLAAGMNNHVGKPINVDELVQKLRIYLLGEEPKAD